MVFCKKGRLHKHHDGVWNNSVMLCRPYINAFLTTLSAVFKNNRTIHGGLIPANRYPTLHDGLHESSNFFNTVFKKVVECAKGFYLSYFGTFDFHVEFRFYQCYHID